MFPGMNNRQAQQMMKKMGMNQQDIAAQQVIIVCDGENIVIDNPSVAKINMMGNEVFQVSGEARVEATESVVEISEDDIQTVAEQTGVDHQTAKDAITKHNGDLAEAILALQEN